MRTLKVGKNDAGQRLDKFLSKTLVNLPQSLLYKYFRKKCIKVNGVRVPPETLVCVGDEISLYISDEFFADKQSDDNGVFMRKDVTLEKSEIVYEDDNIMIIDKPQGVLVHSSLPDEKAKEDEVCLVDKFVGYLYKTGQYDPSAEQSFTPSLCNRLDRNTCGLVIAAKTASALKIMNQKVKNREMTKLYLAQVHGSLPKKEDTLQDFLYKDRSHNRVYVFSSREQAKKALKIKYDDDIKTIITKYRVLKSDGKASIVEIDLVTGRTHQIRAHLSYIGNPIVGDGKYGVNHEKESGIKYQRLCSKHLVFKFTTPAGELSYLNGMSFESKFEF